MQCGNAQLKKNHRIEWVQVGTLARDSQVLEDKEADRPSQNLGSPQRFAALQVAAWTKQPGPETGERTVAEAWG